MITITDSLMEIPRSERVEHFFMPLGLWVLAAVGGWNEDGKRGMDCRTHSRDTPERDRWLLEATLS